MASISIGYFVEDLAHSSFLKSLVVRVASEHGLDASTLVHDLRNASGGASRALGELRQFARDVRRERESPFDILIAAIDTNCRRAHSVKRRILDTLAVAGYPGTAVCATPNPHIERWYLADPRGFKSALGSTTIPQLPRYKCESDYYKHALRNALISAGIAPVLGGAEFGPDIVAQMDLYRAARRDTSLKHFIDDLRAAFTPFLGHSD